MRLFAHASVAIACCAFVVACSDTPDPNDPSNYDPNAGYGYGNQPGGYPNQPGGYPNQPGAYPNQPGGYPAQPGQPAPTQPAPAPAAAGGKATPISPAAAAAAGPLLQGMAAQHTQGMRPDGQSFAGQFQQGQKLEQPFQIQPGRCYAVVGVGLGVSELDIQIVLHQPPLPEYVAAQDQGSGSQAVLGGGGNCFKNPLPVGAPAKVVMTATAGSGIATAQIYSK